MIFLTKFIASSLSFLYSCLKVSLLREREREYIKYNKDIVYTFVILVSATLVIIFVQWHELFSPLSVNGKWINRKLVDGQMNG